jgi:CHAT domain-containing protein/tetratricopeptide (TPR) repeat protein
MEIAQRLGPTTSQYSHAANYLGLLAKNLGRYEEARLHYERALAAFRQTRPGGIEVAGVLTNLGNVALLEGNLESALGYHQEALDLKRQLDPGSVGVASSLHSLGQVERWRGQYEIARRSLEQALELKEELSPGSAWVATTLFELGELARIEGAMDHAERLHLRCLEIWGRSRSGSAEHAMSLFALGSIEEWRDRPDAAETLWREAIAIIEERRSRIGMTGADRTRFGSRYHGYYVELARLLAERGRETEAWDVLERSRTGALRAVVSRRDVAPAGVPPELWFASNRLERQVDRLEARLARLEPSSDAAINRLRAELTAVEADLVNLTDEISRSAPRYAAVSTPRVIAFARYRELHDPGTVVLSYSVGEQRGTVLVAAADASGELAVRAFPIAAGAEELARRVNIFRALVHRGRAVDDLETALIAQGRRLFEMLIGPALGEITAAERVLIIPDGPLVDLPFAALVLPGEPLRFLGQVKPLLFSPSAGVFAELSQRRTWRSGESLTVAAFGDPDYPSRTEVARRHGLRPLPGSRSEVASISRLFGSSAAVFLGPEATEQAFRSSSRGARILHCAVHAESDRRFPMDSALFFSIPDGTVPPENDGVLTAWEIVDGFNTDADVVVLSACSTARGQAVPGEGIVGLARAFQVAGASTLVVSQWAVPDRSTAELMMRFYARLKEGTSTAEALMIAQLETAESDPALAHPFHWASFQVRGDWR